MESKKKIKVLLVEDDSHYVSFIRELLRRGKSRLDLQWAKTLKEAFVSAGR